MRASAALFLVLVASATANALVYVVAPGSSVFGGDSSCVVKDAYAASFEAVRRGSTAPANFVRCGGGRSYVTGSEKYAVPNADSFSAFVHVVDRPEYFEPTETENRLFGRDDSVVAMWCATHRFVRNRSLEFVRVATVRADDARAMKRYGLWISNPRRPAVLSDQQYALARLCGIMFDYEL